MFMRGEPGDDQPSNSEFWNLSIFLEGDPKKLVKETLDADRKNASLSEVAVKEWLDIYDRGLVFLFAALQSSYKFKEGWIGKDNLRSALAMIASATNHLILIRHAISMGYYPESQSLFRGVHERSSLALSFVVAPEIAVKFLKGDRINQPEVDRSIADAFADESDPEVSKEIYADFRGKFARRSKLAHPNLQSFVGRTAEFTYEEWKANEIEALANSVGKDIFLGGMQSQPTAMAHLGDGLHEALEVMSVLVMIITDESGQLMDSYRELRKVIEAQIEKLDGIGSEKS